MKDRTLALAGVFQAGELVRQAAHHGTWSGYAAGTLLRSLLQLQSDDVASLYGSTEQMNLGLEVLISVLGGDRENLESLQYVIALLKLERQFSRNKAMQSLVGHELERIAREGGEEPDALQQDEQAGEIAALYSKTISTLSPRIVVQGRPQNLQNDRTVHWIRTLLFAGLRSAFLWQQLGGNRWSLMFGRRRILQDAQQLV